VGAAGGADHRRPADPLLPISGGAGNAVGSRGMRILVTNDDGIESAGLHVLAAKIASLGHSTVVAAPDRDQSGTAASLGRIHADRHLDVRRVELPGAPGVEAFAAAATPGMCVVAGRLGAFGDPPEVVVSGINAGLNVGRAILHSGTVGAALTAQNFGMKGLAVSVEAPDVLPAGVAHPGRVAPRPASGDGEDPWHWHTAAEVTGQVLDLLADAPRRTMLNLNVPGCPLDQVGGVRWAHLDAFGSVRSSIVESRDGRLQFELVATGHEPAADTDRALVRAGFAALTSIVGVAEAWPDPDVVTPEIAQRSVGGAPVEHVHGPEHSRLHLRRHG
jgi:5'-nucleotidase